MMHFDKLRKVLPSPSRANLTYLHAIDNIDEAFLVPERNVARLQPPVRRQRVLGSLGFAPVALHHIRASDPELPPLAHAHLFAVFAAHNHGLDVGVQLADRGVRDDGRRLGAAGAASNLRHSPALLEIDLARRPQALELPLRLEAQRRRAAARALHRRQVEFARLGALGQRDNDGRHERQARHAVVLDVVQHLAEVELLHHVDGDAAFRRRNAVDRLAVGVVHGQHGEADAAGIDGLVVRVEF